MNVPYSVTDRAVTVFVKGHFALVDQTNPNYKALRAAVLKPTHDVQEIAELAHIDTFFSRLTHGRVQVGEDSVRWDGKPVHSSLPKRILALLEADLDILPLVKFLDKLMTNPTESARSELFDWLESGNNPITPDGNFLAFKKVRRDYKDQHTGTFDNSVGKVVQMDRSLVDPNRYNYCSSGLHFCSHGYLHMYSGDVNYRTMVVEVDPADVVSIPTDYQHQKGRAWRYKVIGEITQDRAATLFEGKPVVALGPMAPVDPEVGYVPDAPLPGGDVAIWMIGDTVRCVSVIDGDALTEGNEYTILEVSAEGDEIRVTDDDGDEWGFNSEQFELVDEVNVAQESSEEDDEGDEENTEITSVETTTTETTVKTVEQLYTVHGGKSYTKSELKDLVAKNGQRGTCRLIGVARSTLQGWIA